MTPEQAKEAAKDLRKQLEQGERYGPVDALDPHDGSVQARVEEMLAAALLSASAGLEIRKALRRAGEDHPLS